MKDYFEIGESFVYCFILILIFNLVLVIFFYYLPWVYIYPSYELKCSPFIAKVNDSEWVIDMSIYIGTTGVTFPQNNFNDLPGNVDFTDAKYTCVFGRFNLTGQI